MGKSNNCNLLHPQKLKKWEHFAAQSLEKLFPCIQVVTISKISIPAFIIIRATVPRIPLKKWQMTATGWGVRGTWKVSHMAINPNYCTSPFPLVWLPQFSPILQTQAAAAAKKHQSGAFWRGAVLNGLQCKARSKMSHSGDVIAFYLAFIYLLCRDRGIICVAIFFLPAQSPLQNEMHPG